MKLFNKTTALLLLCSALSFSCTKDISFIPALPKSNIPGMGTAGGDLQGTPFIFPEGIEILGQISGYDYNTGHPCQVIGKSPFVHIILSMLYHGPDTSFILPAGITFKSLSEEDQNGILIQKETLHFTTGDTCTTVINLFCINASRHASNADSRFSIGPVTNAPSMLELIDLLKHKRIADDIGIVQGIVWDVSDYGGLTKEDRNVIAALPDL